MVQILRLRVLAYNLLLLVVKNSEVINLDEIKLVLKMGRSLRLLVRRRRRLHVGAGIQSFWARIEAYFFVVRTMDRILSDVDKIAYGILKAVGLILLILFFVFLFIRDILR